MSCIRVFSYNSRTRSHSAGKFRTSAKKCQRDHFCRELLLPSGCLVQVGLKFLIATEHTVLWRTFFFFTLILYIYILLRHTARLLLQEDSFSWWMKEWLVLRMANFHLRVNSFGYAKFFSVSRKICGIRWMFFVLSELAAKLWQL